MYRYSLKFNSIDNKESIWDYHAVNLAVEITEYNHSFKLLLHLCMPESLVKRA